MLYTVKLSVADPKTRHQYAGFLAGTELKSFRREAALIPLADIPAAVRLVEDKTGLELVGFVAEPVK